MHSLDSRAYACLCACCLAATLHTCTRGQILILILILILMSQDEDGQLREFLLAQRECFARGAFRAACAQAFGGEDDPGQAAPHGGA